MNRLAITRLRRHLLTQAGLPTQSLVRKPIRIWRLSGVERLLLPDGSSVVFKYALPPFTYEHRILTHVAAQAVPVPHVYAATQLDGILGMILEDLGEPIREPTQHDAAVAAVRLHAASPASWLETLRPSDLAALPAKALACLEQLRSNGRYTEASDLVSHLTALDRIAAIRAADAERPPFGLCHGELHPTALHIGQAGWRLLDFAMAITGSGLLDLAAWSGLRQPPDPSQTRTLIELYAHKGGHTDALRDRGGLPAERWALGWHRVHAATWLLDCATSGIDDPTTDPRHLVVLRRQLTGALELLAG